MGRRLNYRLAKIHRNYTVEEAATLFGVHRNTVREWIKRGLPVIAGRPVLMLGRELRAFLLDRRANNRRPCGPGQIYCVRCRSPREPALGMVEYHALTAILGNLVGICSHCEALIYRRVNCSRLSEVLGPLTLTTTESERHIDDTVQATVNSDFERQTGT